MLNIGNQVINVDGMQVEYDALRIAERIKEYDPNLEILCLDPNRASSISEEPFVIAEHCKDGVLRPVLRCWKLDGSVLERIRAADGAKSNALDVVEAFEANQKKLSEQRYKEQHDENVDVIHHVLKDRKSRYTVRDSRTGDLLTFYDDRPTERKSAWT